MIVIQKSFSDSNLSNRDYMDKVVVRIDGVNVFSVHDGEPEDNNLRRNFNDCYSVLRLMERMYEAGKAGEVVEFREDEI